VTASSASTPFLATVPLRAAPARRRRWWLAAAVGTAVVAVVALVALATVPVSESISEELTVSNPGSPVSAVVVGISFPRGATFGFSWATTDGRTVTLSFTGPTGSTLYRSDASTGHASVGVTGGESYDLGVYDALPETVQVSGTLDYSAPLL